MTKMKTAILRDHNFQHRLTRITLEGGYFYFYFEGPKKADELRTKATERGLRAFEAEDWQYFEALLTIYSKG